MNFNKLVTDINEGLKQNISSRKENKYISIKEFDLIYKKYFNNIKKDRNLIIKCEENTQENLVFILRWYYQLWIELKQSQIEIYSIFPNEFKIINEVNKNNHPHTPRTFKVGTIMYFNNSGYSLCNWLNGIPLWDNLEDINKTLRPSCQINYNYIKAVKS
jgi:hypothetical protein